MFYYVKGTVAHLSDGIAVIDCAGVGYALKTSGATLSALKPGETAKLYTYLHVREDIFELYGFISLEELNCFRQLIGVSGVGPKAAVSILSAVTPSALAVAVITQDEKALTAAQGVGKKLAQRIVLELRDKIAKESLNFAADGPTGTASLPGAGRGMEAVSALAVLGYSSAEAMEALKGIDVENTKIEDVIRMALSRLLK